MRSGLQALRTGNAELYRRVTFQSSDGDSADHRWTLNPKVGRVSAKMTTSLVYNRSANSSGVIL